MKIVLATNNFGKLKEFKKLFQSTPLMIVPQHKFNVPPIEETGLTFVENAIIKARHASWHTKLPAIADDSGLEVDILNGKPGIYSARYASAKLGSKGYCSRLLSELKNIPVEQRTAHFRCVLVFLRHAEDPSPIIGQGTWEGRILFEPIGENGFGYDPVFYLENLKCSVAQLKEAEKNKLSHRSQAMKNLWEQMKYVCVKDS